MPCLRQCSTNGKLHIIAQSAPQALVSRSQTLETPCESLATRDRLPKHLATVTNYRLGIRLRDLGLSNTLSATVAFLLLPDTNLLPQAGITHYSQLLTRQHSTKLFLVCVCVCVFLSRSKLIFKVPTTTWGVPPG